MEQFISTRHLPELRLEDKTNALLAEIERLKKVNAALLKRVENSTNHHSNAFALFENNISLNKLIDKRTEELQSLNKKFQQERNLIRGIIQAFPGKIILLDSKYNILQKYAGADNTIYFGGCTNLSDCMNINNQQALAAAIKDLDTNKNKYVEFEFSHTKLESSEQHIHAMVSSFSNDTYILFLRDITDLVNQKNELKSKDAMIAHASKLSTIGEMSAGIAHEINNPLTAISLHTSVIEKIAGDPEKLKAKIASINKSISRIQKIADGLRRFSRNSNETQNSNESIAKIVSESITLIESKIKKFDITVISEINEHHQILCDSMEIEQVVINLVNNSIDAIKDLEKRWIRIETRSCDSNIKLQIHDSGFGISTEIENKMFQAFYTTKELNEGTGLGLSIVKGILDRHNATIKINREFPNTCFEITFPNSSSAKFPI